MRSALLTFSNREGIKVTGGAPEPGQMWLKIEYEAAGKDFLFAAGSFLLEGLNSIAREYPDNCKLSIVTSA
jgi:hypothetical protein